MATAKQIIDKALSYEGVKENPANSNNVIFNTHYYGKTVSGKSYEWCCVFVWDIFRMCNASNLFYNGNKVASCPLVGDWAIKNKLTVPKNQGQYGDIVLFDFNQNKTSDHIGFIIKKNSDGSYLTVEGNTGVGNDSNGGEVMQRTRYQSQINYIIRPKYDEESTNMSTSSLTLSSKTDIIKVGQQHANNFVEANLVIDGVRGTNTIKASKKILQHAINLDYKKNLVVDGIWGNNSSKALGNHSVRLGEKQYMITALEILLMLKGYNPNGVECPGIFGNGLKGAVMQYQKDNKLTIDGIAGRNTFLSLIS